MRILVIIPTFNEEKNIELLIPRIKYPILIVDDNSQDNTQKIVKELQKGNRKIFLLVGPRKSFGQAYLRGFRYAIKKKYDVVVMMDADLSHPSQKIPEMIEQINAGYEFVIGSRYVRGGSIEDWGLRRRLISKVGNKFARISTGLKVKDSTSGYNTVKTSVLRKIINKNYPNSYAFQLRLKYNAQKSNANLTEIPINFTDRIYGTTKMTNKDIIDFIIECIKIWTKNLFRS